jgi:cbb3-type cytochrome oxidase subunit 3
MRALLTDFFARSPAMAGPVFAILLFFTVFALVVAYLVWGKRERFDALAAIALDDGEPARRADDE